MQVVVAVGEGNKLQARPKNTVHSDMQEKQKLIPGLHRHKLSDLHEPARMLEKQKLIPGLHSHKLSDFHEPVAHPMLVLSQKTYHKNDFINEFLESERVDLHSTEKGVTEHTGERVKIINMPGMHDTDPQNVVAVKGTITEYLKSQATTYYSALILLFLHPIRWSGEDQDFVRTISESVGAQTLKSNTFVVIADHKKEEEPFPEYVDTVIKDYSSPKNKWPPCPATSINKLGDLFSIVTPQRIYSAEEISASTYKKQSFLNAVLESKPFQINVDKKPISGWVWCLLGVGCAFLFASLFFAIFFPLEDLNHDVDLHFQNIGNVTVVGRTH